MAWPTEALSAEPVMSPISCQYSKQLIMPVHSACRHLLRKWKNKQAAWQGRSVIFATLHQRVSARQAKQNV
eukprot:1157827-Pelagomonas_calceolata.AAC.2